MTTGPVAGPASAYEIFRTPASICFSGPNDTFVPGLISGSFVLAVCAFAGISMPNWAAVARAAEPKKLRRWRLISLVLLIGIMTRLQILRKFFAWGRAARCARAACLS